MVDWVLWIYGKMLSKTKRIYCFRRFKLWYTKTWWQFQSNGSSRVWLDLMESFNFTQLVDTLTRVTSHSSTLIGHVFTNTPCNILETNVPSYSISDHFPICITRKPNKPSSQGHVHKFITYRKMDSFDENSFRLDLSQQPWSNLNSFTDQSAALQFLTILFFLFSIYMPL